jgi:outer membrane protein OmpA-like peptidoglycan-associated protein
MKKFNSVLLALCFGLTIGTAVADDSGSFPGYVASPSGTGSKTIVKTQYGECVHNQYYQASYGHVGCDGVEAPVESAPVVVTMVSESSVELFNFNADTLTSQGQQTLTTYATNVKSAGTVSSVTIVGNTDMIGSEEYNQKLSQDRANTVQNFLAGQGIDASLITASGVGSKNATASQECFKQYGKDDLDKIYSLTAKLKSATPAERKHINAELSKLETKHKDLLACTAADRNVSISATVTPNQAAGK